MRNTFSSILVALACGLVLSCQQSEQNRTTPEQHRTYAEQNRNKGLSIQTPDGWLAADKNELARNLDRFDISEDKITRLMADGKASILIAAFMKYDPKTTAGLIPTIQVNVRRNQTSDFGGFKAAIINSAKGLGTQLDDYEMIGEPQEIDISGIRSVFVLGKFSMHARDGRKLNVRSRTYASPMRDYFYQVNFTDGPDNEDCSREFDDVLKTIRIGVE